MNLVLLGLVTIVQSQNPLRFEREAVVSDSQIASQVGAEILAKGGNAVDAAIATGFALAVTLPPAGNLGGGGFMVVRMASGRCVAIDYRETAPKQATRDMYLDASGKVVADASLYGHLAVGVPGTVAGFAEAHRWFGKLPWRDLVEPAVRLAQKGWVLSYEWADSFRRNEKVLGKNPESKRIFLRDGKYYVWGDRFAQSDLAKTLRRVRDKGAKGFYEGETARLIAVDMKANGGLIGLDDLREYRPVVREPIRLETKGYVIWTMPPPSSGGICLGEMLNVLSGFDLKAKGWNSSAYLHTLTETMKRAFADRAEYMGDPGFVNIPATKLLSSEYADTVRAAIPEDKATPAEQIKPGLGPAKEGEHTTHFSVVDRDGNAVSNTYTLNTSYGSGVVANGTGVLLNNEMDDFAAKVGVPNGYGLIQGAANSIEPGKRPLSSMTPTVVLKDDHLFMVLGSPGGPTIINTVLQTILNVTEFGMNVQQAVSAPRFHHQWLPDRIRFEPFGLPDDVRRAMEAKGHKFEPKAELMGSCQAIMVDAKTGHRLVGVDPRIHGAGAAGR